MNCPKCNSGAVRRKRRKLFDKLWFLNKKKFKCYDCKELFFSR